MVAYVRDIFGAFTDDLIRKANNNSFVGAYLNDEYCFNLQNWAAECAKIAIENIKGLSSYIYSFENGRNSKLLEDVQLTQKYSIHNEVPLLYLAGVSFGHKINKHGTLITDESIYISGRKTSVSVMRVAYVFDENFSCRDPFETVSYSASGYSGKEKLLVQEMVETLLLVVQFYHYIGTKDKTPRLILGKNEMFVKPAVDFSIIRNAYMKKDIVADTRAKINTEEKIIEFIKKSYEETYWKYFCMRGFGRSELMKQINQICKMTESDEEFIIGFIPSLATYGLVLTNYYLYVEGKNVKGRIRISDIATVSVNFSEHLKTQIIINKNIIVDLPFFGLTSDLVDRFVSMIPTFCKWIQM